MEFLSDVILGNATVNGVLSAPNTAATLVDTDAFLVLDAGVVKKRTGAQTLGDIGAEPVFTKGNVVQQTGMVITGTASGRLVGAGDLNIAFDQVYGDARYMFNRGSLAAVSINSNLATGTYLTQSTSPTTGTFPAGVTVNNGHVLVVRKAFDTNAVHQMMHINTGELATRFSEDNAASWSTWRKMWDSVNLPNPASITAGTVNVLPKYTSGSGLGPSNISDNGTTITLGSNSVVSGSLTTGIISASAAGTVGLFTDTRSNTHTLAASFKIQNNADVSVSTLAHNLLDLDYAAQASGVTGQYVRFLTGGTERVGLGLVNDDFVITTAATTRLTVTQGGNMGLNIIPSAWNTAYRAVQIGGSGALWSVTGTGGDIYLSSNVLFNASSNYVRLNTGFASDYYQQNGQHVWRTAVSAAAGSAITFVTPMLLNAAGNLLLNTLTDAGFRLDVNGTARISGNLTTNLTAGSIPFIGASGLLSQNNSNLFWDSTNNRLGLGTTVPAARIHARVAGTINTQTTVLHLTDTSGGTTNGAAIDFSYSASNILNARIGAVSVSGGGASLTFGTAASDGAAITNHVFITKLGNSLFGTGSDNTIDRVQIGGSLSVSSIPARATAATVFLTVEGTQIRSRTITQLLSDIGGIASSSLNTYVASTLLNQRTIQQNIRQVYTNALDDGGIIDEYLYLGDYYVGKTGHIIRNVTVSSGLVTDIQTDFIRVEDLPLIPESHVIDNNLWNTIEW